MTAASLTCGGVVLKPGADLAQVPAASCGFAQDLARKWHGPFGWGAEGGPSGVNAHWPAFGRFKPRRDPRLLSQELPEGEPQGGYTDEGNTSCPK